MRFKRRKVKRGRVEIIPMIDTIVILLIFYMTFSRFAEAGREANLKLPDSRAGEELVQKAGQVVINMFDADELRIDKRQYKVSELAGFLRGIKQRPEYANMAVILRGSRTMTYKDLSDFMKACAKAGVADVTFTTTEPR
jgi:biopolymer transport protein ExbD